MFYAEICKRNGSLTIGYPRRIFPGRMKKTSTGSRRMNSSIIQMIYEILNRIVCNARLPALCC